MKNYTLFLVLLFYTCRLPDSEKMRFGAVSTATPEASVIGMKVLEKGGNAIDAAIAISFALNVSEPAMSGIGGGCQIQIMLGENAIPFSINGSTYSPGITPLNFEKDSLREIIRSTIPSLPRVLEYIYHQYGSGRIAWTDLVQPAIDLVEEGIEPGPFRKKVYDQYLTKLQDGLPSTEEYIIDDESGRWFPRKLGTCLREIALHGSRAFYQDSISSGILRDMKKYAGWISAEDLQNLPEPIISQSAHFTYQGYDVYTQPEPAGGWIVKAMLQHLEKNSASDKSSLIDAIHEGHTYRENKAKKESLSGETTHFSVMDASGMAVSFTSSINAYYGAGLASNDYGFLYNSYMDDFNYIDRSDKYALGPLKMAYSSMSPTIVLKDGQVVMIIGSPGSSRIISTVAQLIHYYSKENRHNSSLLSIPRIHAKDGKVYLERLEDSIYVDKNKYSIHNPSDILAINGVNAYFGGVHAIVKGTSGYLALADPRRDGVGLVK